MAGNDGVAGLIGKFNNLSTQGSNGGGGFLSPFHCGDRGRKTSAFVTSSSLSPSSSFRKTSATVLMPTKSAMKTKSAYDDGGEGNCLAVSPRSPKKVSLAVGKNNQSPSLDPAVDGPSTPNGRSEVTPERKITYLVSKATPLPEGERRGFNLGRSKSLRCDRVKLGPKTHVAGGISNGQHVLPEGSVKVSPFAKFREIEQSQVSLTVPMPGDLARQISLPSVNAPPSPRSPASPSPAAHGTETSNSKPVARSPSSAKEIVLAWVQERVNVYPNVNVTNFSTSWSDGLAFCALIHHYYPEAFDFDQLKAESRRHNFTLAFETAEKYADICPLLDVEDMMIMKKPDWKCVFTYVQSFFRRFRNGRDPGQRRKTETLGSGAAELLSAKYSEKRIE